MIQIWNGGDRSGEDGATAGSYCMFDVTTRGNKQIDGTYGSTSCTSGGQISAWQAFFIERTGSSGSVVFKAGGTTNNTRDIIGEKSAQRTQYVRMGLGLSVEDASGDVVARDGAAALYFHSEATTGVDGYDASKLTPLVYPYATIGPVGPTRDGTEAIKAVESLPRDTALPVTIPLRLKTGGDVEGTATLQASRWVNVPDDWTATLVDTKGTDDPSDDEEHPLSPSSEGYTFQIGSQKNQASVNGKTSPPGRVLHPSRTSTKTEATREHDGPQPYLPASLSMTDRMQRRAKAGKTNPTRFKIRISGAPLPVELAQFDAVLDGTAAQLRWRTESETNNAGFQVQRRGPGTDGFEALGFVESKASGGTTSTPTSYRFQSESLSPGRHVFRLRQKDLDGTTSHSAPRAVRVRQDAPLRVRVAPNPMRAQSTLTVRLQSAQKVEAALYDVLGRRVQTVADQTLSGSQRHKFNLRVGDLPSGTYFLRVRSEQGQITRRVTVLR